MDNIAISVKNLSKKYHLYESPKHRLKEALHPFRKKYHHDFWALKDVSFEAKKGETVGIIGKNGSGKSTLLQILSGVLQPTKGEAVVNGRVSALLELGTGFDPAFTGRQNVYMNGALMGLTRKEMDKRFQAIAGFADIGEFIDQPVKTYSSGMYVRLAFAAAINVNPDILIVDEALAVGDIAFRNKCMARINEMRDRGTTILFVSHDLGTLQMICNGAVWLNNGQIVSVGDPIAVCQEFYAFMTGANVDSKKHHEELIAQQDTGMAKFIEFKLDRTASEKGGLFNVGDDIAFNFSLLAQEPLKRTVFAVSIYRADGDWLVGMTSGEKGISWPSASSGEIRQGQVVLSPNCFSPGDYFAALGAYSEDLSLCYALTELTVAFSVRSDFPTWGKFLHPCRWIM